MAQTVKHLKTSAIPDGSDVNQVQPSDWNADHVITGSVDQSQVTSLVSDLALKAPLVSPAFTGNPTAPTATPGDSDTSVATTGFVGAAVIAAGIAPIAPGFRNRVVNGDFAIDQRYSGTLAIIPTGTVGYGPDRWFAYTVSPAVIGLQQIADTTNLGEFYLAASVGTVDTTLASTDRAHFGQVIEGHMMRGFGWGNAQAKQVTISFTAWANANYTLAFALRNSAGNRCYVSTFAVTTSRQRFSFVIPGDVTGAWNYDSSIGLELDISLASGTGGHASTLNTWLAGNFTSHSSCSNFMAAGNTFYIKDVQLEMGATVTDFERLPRPEQITRCQRYYQRVGSVGSWPHMNGYTTAGLYLIAPVGLPAIMRAAPTALKVGTWTVTNCSQPVVSGLNPGGISIQVQVTATGTAGCYPSGVTDMFELSAEMA